MYRRRYGRLRRLPILTTTPLASGETCATRCEVSGRARRSDTETREEGRGEERRGDGRRGKQNSDVSTEASQSLRVWRPRVSPLRVPASPFPSPLRQEDLSEFLRRYNFELFVCAVRRLFVSAPSPELSYVAETAALHVIVGHFDDQLRAQRLPRQILALTPPALCSRHSTPNLPFGSCFLCQSFPRMPFKCIFAIWRKELSQLAALAQREAGAPPYVLERARLIEKTEQK